MAKNREIVCLACRAPNSGLAPTCYLCGAALDPTVRTRPRPLGNRRRPPRKHLEEDSPWAQNNIRELEDRHDPGN